MPFHASRGTGTGSVEFSPCVKVRGGATSSSLTKSHSYQSAGLLLSGPFSPARPPPPLSDQGESPAHFKPFRAFPDALAVTFFTRREWSMAVTTCSAPRITASLRPPPLHRYLHNVSTLLSSPDTSLFSSRQARLSPFPQTPESLPMPMQAAFRVFSVKKVNRNSFQPLEVDNVDYIKRIYL